LGFFYGRKTRYAIFRSSGGMNPSFMQDNGSSSSVFYNGGRDGGILGTAITGEPDARTADLVVSIGEPPYRAEIPLKVGARAKVGDVDVAVGSIKPGARPAGPAPQNGFRGGRPEAGKHWTLVLASTQDAQAYSNETYVPLDAERQPIRYVDLAGRPITATQFVALGGNPNEPFGMQAPGGTKRAAKCSIGSVEFVARVQGAVELSINVDPSQVAYLAVTEQREVRVRFRHIPLDPKD